MGCAKTCMRKVEKKTMTIRNCVFLNLRGIVVLKNLVTDKKKLLVLYEFCIINFNTLLVFYIGIDRFLVEQITFKYTF